MASLPRESANVSGRARDGWRRLPSSSGRVRDADADDCRKLPSPPRPVEKASRPRDWERS